MVTVYVSQNGDSVPGERYIGNDSVPIIQALEYLYTVGGGEIFIENGSYYLNTVINISQSNIKIKGEGLHTKLAPVNNASQTTLFTVVGSSTKTLKNITIEDISFGWGLEAGIGGNGLTVNYVEGAKIKGCVFRSNRVVGLQILNSKNIEVENNIVDWNGTDGLYLSGSSNIKVRNNIIQNNAGQGVYGIKCDKIHFESNVISYCEKYGMVLHTFLNSIVANNLIKNHKTGGIFVGTTSLNNTISNNIVRNSSTYGINISDSNLTSISYNSIVGTNSYGIFFKNSNRSIISGNNVSNINYGIQLNASSYNTVTGNQINNVIGGINTLSGTSYNSITGNAISNSESFSTKLSSGVDNNDIVGNVGATPTTNIGSDNYIYE